MSVPQEFFIPHLREPGLQRREGMLLIQEGRVAIRRLRSRGAWFTLKSWVRFVQAGQSNTVSENLSMHENC